MQSNYHLLRFSWVSTIVRVLETLWTWLILTFSLLVWEMKPLRCNLLKPGCKILLGLGTNLRVTVLPLHRVQLGHICSLILCQVTMLGVLGKPLLIAIRESTILWNTLTILGICWSVAQMFKKVRQNSYLKITWKIGWLCTYCHTTAQTCVRPCSVLNKLELCNVFTSSTVRHLQRNSSSSNHATIPVQAPLQWS